MEKGKRSTKTKPKRLAVSDRTRPSRSVATRTKPRKTKRAIAEARKKQISELLGLREDDPGSQE